MVWSSREYFLGVDEGRITESQPLPNSLELNIQWTDYHVPFLSTTALGPLILIFMGVVEESKHGARPSNLDQNPAITHKHMQISLLLSMASFCFRPNNNTKFYPETQLNFPTITPVKFGEKLAIAKFWKCGISRCVSKLKTHAFIAVWFMRGKTQQKQKEAQSN